jgi:hypothetical protein
LFHDPQTEQTLWKSVHYKIIQEFRKSLKLLKKGEDRYTNTLIIFKSFLVQVFGFYLKLVIKIHSKFGILDPFIVDELKLVWQEPTEFVQPKIPSQELASQLYLLIYQSLIYMGDVSRYKELYAEKYKRWAIARKFYQLAHYLNPNNGNPLNQLAVIDTLDNRHFSAIGMYINSLVAKEPFPTALENLHSQFERYKQKEHVEFQGMFCALLGRWFYPTREYF